jgi:hypothetical protein
LDNLPSSMSIDSRKGNDGFSFLDSRFVRAV